MNGSWAIAVADPSLVESGQALAARSGRPLVSATSAGHALLLVVTHHGLELRRTGPEAPGPLHIDFAGGRMRHRLRTSGRRSPLARAVGVRPGHLPSILDATAGLGQDAFVLASLGCSMILLERALPVFLLLEDGLRRARQAGMEAASRMALYHADAIDWLQETGGSPDTIYLDPMYPKRTKQALSGKGMQLLQQLAGADEDGTRLLEAAIGGARKRVVVKRPARAAPLGGRAPAFSITSPKTRYDIYTGEARA